MSRKVHRSRLREHRSVIQDKSMDISWLEWANSPRPMSGETDQMQMHWAVPEQCDYDYIASLYQNASDRGNAKSKMLDEMLRNADRNNVIRIAISLFKIAIPHPDCGKGSQIIRLKENGKNFNGRFSYEFNGFFRVTSESKSRCYKQFHLSKVKYDPTWNRDINMWVVKI